MGIRIDALDAVPSAQADYEIPAMRGGATVKLSAQQLATFIVALVTDSAPATLDTLNELAAALGDDPNFATTVASALAEKASLTGVETLTNKTLTAPVVNAPQGEFIRGLINGLTLSNNTGDATNDIDIATGSAASNQATPRLMTLAGTLTKRLDANWAAGTDNGMRWSGEAIGNKTYHLFLGTKSDGSDGDVFAYPGTAGTDADSAAFAATVLAAWQAETGGSAYVRVRRIGSIIREGGALVSFWHRGSKFLRTPIASISGTSSSASALSLVNVPVGIVVEPILSLKVAASGSSNISMQLGSAWSGSANRDIIRLTTDAGGAGTTDGNVSGGIFTNASAQIYFARTIAAGTALSTSVTVEGWIDTRGQN